jgi:predicted dehydrogenase
MKFAWRIVSASMTPQHSSWNGTSTISCHSGKKKSAATMRALFRDQWVGEFLDDDVRPGQYQIAVQRWCTLQPVTGLYFVRPRDPRMVWNYLKELGPVAVWTKIQSRWAERHRNEKFLSCGLGVVQNKVPGGLNPGDAVLFVAPKHPQCVDRLVLAADWVQPWPHTLDFEAELQWIAAPPATAVTPSATAPASSPEAHTSNPSIASTWQDTCAGWDAESGWPCPTEALTRAFRECTNWLQQCDWNTARRLPRSVRPPTSVDRPEASIVSRRASSAASGPQRLTAALYGYGNYAKTVILPNVRRHLNVTAIHEVDPFQLGRISRRLESADTAAESRETVALKSEQRAASRRPWSVFMPSWWNSERRAEHRKTGPLRSTNGCRLTEDRYDAYLIAGYHHTHAALAVAALQRGSAAVVEKPIATTLEQLSAVLNAMESGSTRLFECFQRRYTVLNEWARDDLQLTPGEPVDYHAVVYEVPLPSKHWYRWPNSRTRLTSNGCHWIDHFLYLNQFSQPATMQVHAGPREIVNVSITLENGAFGTLVLTDIGSERIGVQDHVELRANGRTVFIENNARYVCEGRYGIIRRRRVHKLDAYRRMYQSIARQIADGDLIDARTSLRVSAGTTLALEALWESSQPQPIVLPQGLGNVPAAPLQPGWPRAA